MTMCTNLSNQIFDNQFSFGKAEAGKQNRMVKKSKDPTAVNSFRLFNIYDGSFVAKSQYKIRRPDFDKLLRLEGYPIRMYCLLSF